MITVTDSAIYKITQIVESQAKTEAVAPVGIRCGVQGGGCSGFSYQIDFVTEDQIEPLDEVIEIGDIKVVVDAMSVMYLIGTQLDYVEEVFGSRFSFSNPNEVSRCGCGESFSV